MNDKLDNDSRFIMEPVFDRENGTVTVSIRDWEEAQVDYKLLSALFVRGLHAWPQYTDALRSIHDDH